MTKSDLTIALLERLRDPFDTQCDADIATLDFLNVDEAAGYLADLRRDEDAAELDQDERLPQEVTPELYMEVWNCEIRRCRHDLWVERLADWLKKNEEVFTYTQHHDEYANDGPDIEPMDLLYEYDLNDLPFIGGDYDIVDLLTIGMRSKDTFTPADDFYWYDEKQNRLISSSTPYADGIIDATALARHIVETGGECLDDVLSIMSPENRFLTFGSADEEDVRKWLN